MVDLKIHVNYGISLKLWIASKTKRHLPNQSTIPFLTLPGATFSSLWAKFFFLANDARWLILKVAEIWQNEFRDWTLVPDYKYIFCNLNFPDYDSVRKRRMEYISIEIGLDLSDDEIQGQIGIWSHNFWLFYSSAFNEIRECEISSNFINFYISSNFIIITTHQFLIQFLNLVISTTSKSKAKGKFDLQFNKYCKSR